MRYWMERLGLKSGEGLGIHSEMLKCLTSGGVIVCLDMKWRKGV